MGLKKCESSEIYNLSGQTSVGLSFDQPVETIESIGIGILNFLEAIKIFNPSIKYQNAGSSECFGIIGDASDTESTSFSPLSPYVIAKVVAHNLVSVYRRGMGYLPAQVFYLTMNLHFAPIISQLKNTWRKVNS